MLVEYLLDAVTRTLPHQLLEPSLRETFKIASTEHQPTDLNDLASILSPSINPETALPADQPVHPFVLQSLPSSAFVVAASQAPPVSDASLCG